MKKRRRHTGLIITMLILVAAAGTLFAGRHTMIERIKTKAATEIGKKLMEEQLGREINIDGREVNVSDIVNRMEEQDVKAVTDIVEKYISSDNVKQAADMAASGDTEGLKNMAESQLTEEDKNELRGIYEKYKDQIPSEAP
ncbi:MAG: hypothetical protein HFH41_13060 [Lachnospiraceae bacterium]|nr:hypothetical protein [Lachnospiraceae bacterium]